MPPALNIFKHVKSVGAFFLDERTWNLGSVLPETLLLLLLLLSHYH